MTQILRFLTACTVGLIVVFNMTAQARADGHSSPRPIEQVSVSDIMTSEQLQILEILKSYERFVNDSDSAGLRSIYKDDAVLIPEGFDVYEGAENIEGFYSFAFSALTLNLEFNIDPANINVAGDIAFATTDSTGTRFYKETNQTVPEINRELWVFERVGEDWKISRYCFNKSA